MNQEIGVVRAEVEIVWLSSQGLFYEVIGVSKLVVIKLDVRQTQFGWGERSGIF